MSQFSDHYQKEVVPALKKQFGYSHDAAVPRIRKVVLNVGISVQKKDPKTEETVRETLRRITGQQPVTTLAKQSISNFKIRKGMVVGMQVTLHGKRMQDFISRFVNITLPRVRDFRGLNPDSIDPRGNCTIGFRESIAFPEMRSDEIERVHGLEVTIVTDAKNKERALALLRLLGFPFRDK